MQPENDIEENKRKYIVHIYSKRTSFAINVAATSYTSILKEYEKPITYSLIIRDFRNDTPDGSFEGIIDTGANTSCMQTAYTLQHKFPIYKLQRSIEIDTANGTTVCEYAVIIYIQNKDRNDSL